MRVGKSNIVESVIFLEEGRDEVVAEFTEGLTLLDIALDYRIDLMHSCGGMGSCGTCRLVVIEAPVALEPRNDLESDIAIDRGLREDERLGCQTMGKPGLKVRVPVN
jgi:2Fe-2S ferredoxin